LWEQRLPRARLEIPLWPQFKPKLSRHHNTQFCAGCTSSAQHHTASLFSAVRSHDRRCTTVFHSTTTRQENKQPLAHFICIATLSSEGMQNRAHRLLRATFPEGEKGTLLPALLSYHALAARDSGWRNMHHPAHVLRLGGGTTNDRGRSRRIMERRGQKGWECGLRSEQLADRNASDFP
jgi:hypothetical protein